jgi:hypothetical protein
VTRDQREEIEEGRRIIVIVSPIGGAFSMKSQTDLAVAVLGVGL